MRIVFMGTPEFAVPSLKALAQNFEVVLAVTRPDAVRGRGKVQDPSPVKETALALGIPVLETKRMDAASIEAVRDTHPDLIVVAAYGCILPDEIIEMAPYGCINVHASLLPAWRGAAPIQRGILAGDEYLGVSIMKVVAALDAGDYCLQKRLLRDDDSSAEELMARVAELGAKALIEAVKTIFDGTVVWRTQDESLVTFAPKITKVEMKLDPSMSAHHVRCAVQASLDAAPARIELAGRGVRLIKAALATEALKPGEVRVIAKRLILGCSDGSVEVLSIKPDGKRTMDAASFIAGLQNKTAEWGRLL